MLVKTKYSPQPDMVKWKYEYVPDPVEGRKARKTDTLETATVEVNGVPFDADEKSMDRMSRIVAKSYGDIMRKIANGDDPSLTAGYELSQTISWKCADNVTRNVSIQNLVDALGLATDNMTATWL